jgi:DNA-binding XRE family transcriptional regulator
MQAHRAGDSLRDVAPALGVSNVTLSRIERGVVSPSLPTARALARWLGWTLEQVLDAAERPAE